MRRVCSWAVSTEKLVVGYKQVAPLGQKGIERKWIWLLRICSWAAPTEKLVVGYKQVALLGQGYRTEVDLVAQDMFMGRTDG